MSCHPQSLHIHVYIYIHYILFYFVCVDTHLFSESSNLFFNRLPQLKPTTPSPHSKRKKRLTRSFIDYHTTIPLSERTHRLITALPPHTHTVMVISSSSSKVHNYRNAKPHHPPAGGSPGGFRHLTRLLLFLISFAYVGTLLYTRALLRARDEATQLSVTTLQSALNSLQEKYNEAITTQAQLTTEHEATLRLLKDKLALLSKAEHKLEAWGKVEDRLSDSTIIQNLQEQNLLFNHLRWGAGPARVVMEMGEGDEAEEIELELAPFELM